MKTQKSHQSGSSKTVDNLFKNIICFYVSGHLENQSRMTKKFSIFNYVLLLKHRKAAQMENDVAYSSNTVQYLFRKLCIFAPSFYSAKWHLLLPALHHIKYLYLTRERKNGAIFILHAFPNLNVFFRLRGAVVVDDF